MAIPLLTPESVKADSSRQGDEQRARMRDLALEEERLIRSINDLRATETEEKERTERDMKQFRIEQRAERDRLSAEIAPLEARLAILMKPIDRLREDTEYRDGKSKQREADLNDRETLLDIREKDFNENSVEQLEKIHDTQQLQDERDEDLDHREEAVKGEEERSKESLQGLNSRWVQFHETVAAKDAELIERENKVYAGEQANTIRAEELDRRAEDYKEKDREIASRYAALERAHIEILAKQQHD